MCEESGCWHNLLCLFSLWLGHKNENKNAHFRNPLLLAIWKKLWISDVLPVISESIVSDLWFFKRKPRETQLSAKLDKSYFQVAASLYESVNTFFLQLRHWLSSSVAKNQKLNIWHQTADQDQTKDQFCLIFNMCKYILEHFLYFLWS